MSADDVTIEVTVRKKVPVKYLRAQCGVRCWEDATVNGVDDVDGKLIPRRVADNWSPVIELATGKIEGWPEGTTADIHYNVCDDGIYELLDADRMVVKRIEGYVPKIMCPGDRGYGDYVIMQVGADGVIADWKIDFDKFEDHDDE